MSLMPGVWECKRCSNMFVGPTDSWECGDKEYSAKYACPLEERHPLDPPKPKHKEDPNRGKKLFFGFLLLTIICLGVLLCQ